jgi:hypothetical protein
MNNLELDNGRHWVGEFTIKGKSFQGEIIYYKKSGRILLNIEYTTNGIGESYADIPIINGKLTNGVAITLFDNRCTKNHTRILQYVHIQFVAKFMIWSKINANNMLFDKLEFKVENGLLWSGLSRMEEKDLLDIHFLPQEKKEVNLYGAKIYFFTSLKNELWTVPRMEECNVVERLTISIESETKQPISYFFNIRDKIIALISFAIKDNINIEEQILYNYDNYYEMAKNRRYYPFYLITNENYVNIIKNHISEYNFTLNELNQCQNIETKLDKLTPILNLYLSLFKYENMPIEMIFLNIVQALETFHSRFFYEDKKSEYISYVNERFAQSDNFNVYRELLLSANQVDQNCNYIILLSRINDLLIRGKNDIFKALYWQDKEFAQRIVDTRHYYTHYGKSKENKALKGDELVNCIYVLKLILEYHVCAQLDFDISQKISYCLETYFYRKQKNK